MSNEDVLRMDAVAIRDELPRARVALEEAERRLLEAQDAYNEAADRLIKLDQRLTQLVHQQATAHG